MKHLSLQTIVLFFSASLLFASCKKEDGHDHDEEVITHFTLVFTPQGGGAPLSFGFVDPDGPGGIAPTQDQIQLSANSVYTVTLEISNNSVNPPVDIAEEIEEEGEAHRFYFEPSAGSGITVTGLDTDIDGLPLGLNSTWTTTNAGNGTVRVVLRHYGGNPPNKAETDPVNSNKSSTDVDLNFTTVVQ